MLRLGGCENGACEGAGQSSVNVYINLGYQGPSPNIISKGKRNVNANEREGAAEVAKTGSTEHRQKNEIKTN